MGRNDWSASDSKLLIYSDRYIAACIITSWPMTHPLNIAWMSENTGTVGKRTVASGAVIGSANIFVGAYISVTT